MKVSLKPSNAFSGYSEKCESESRIREYAILKKGYPLALVISSDYNQLVEMIGDRKDLVISEVFNEWYGVTKRIQKRRWKR